MELVPLGDSGLTASRVGLGCNNFGGRLDLDGTRAVVDAALDVGVTFLDTAEIYGNGGDSERFLGEVLDGRRDQVVLATKVGWGAESGDGSADNIRRAIDGSLERLAHRLRRPLLPAQAGSVDADRRDARRARRARARREGARDRLLELLRRACSPRPIVSRASSGRRASRCSRTSTACSSAATTTDVLPLCRELGVSYIPYFPLASGVLTGKYRRGEPAPAGTRLEGREIADERLERVGAAARRSPRSAVTRCTSSRSERARVDARSRIDHRRGDEARAGASERRGRLVAAFGRRARPQLARRSDWRRCCSRR